ncbi:MAG: type VI secretion system protein TssA [Planctomycetota bacterium]
MGLIDVEALAAPVSEDAPCGEDLSYDPAFFELETVAQGTEERVMGDEVVAAEEPDWAEVARMALELLGRTRDLRVGMWLVLAALRREGFPGLRDGLTVLRRWLDDLWECLHPQLDPADDNDPTERINVLESIAQPEGSFGDPMRFIRRLHETPLTDSRQLGRYSYRDLLVASGEVARPEDAEGEAPTVQLVEGAFEDTPTEWLTEQAEAAAEATEQIEAIDARVVEAVGAEQAAQLDPFKKALGEVAAKLGEELQSRGYTAPTAGGQAPAEASAAAPAAGPPAQALSGDITGPEDVVRAIDKICDYYARHEPSSPVPLLLRRAQRLVSKSFVEVIQDLSPQALQQIEMIAGGGIDSGAPPE